MRALAQRRNADGHHAQAVEKVLAEFLLRNQRAQVAVGGGDHAHAHANGLLPAHAVELAFLQHAQQFGLRGAVQVAHFIKEDAAAIRQFEFAAA